MTSSRAYSFPDSLQGLDFLFQKHFHKIAYTYSCLFLLSEECSLTNCGICLQSRKVGSSLPDSTIRRLQSFLVLITHFWITSRPTFLPASLFSNSANYANYLYFTTEKTSEWSMDVKSSHTANLKALFLPLTAHLRSSRSVKISSAAGMRVDLQGDIDFPE